MNPAQCSSACEALELSLSLLLSHQLFQQPVALKLAAETVDILPRNRLQYDLLCTLIYDPGRLLQVRADYELVRETIIRDGFSALSGLMGVLVQPRTKGPGHGSISRAFYARSHFVARILGEGYHIPLPVVPK